MKTFYFFYFLFLLSFFHLGASHAEESQGLKGIQEIIVSSVRIPTAAKDISSSIYIISRERIRERGYIYAIDAIASSPGVTTKQNGSFGGVGTVRIRGAASSQTLVLIDGVPVNDASSPAGGYNFDYLDTANIESIEVLKGSQSTLWGSDAIGGVVSIFTRRPTEDSIDISSEVGSFGLRRHNANINFLGPLGQLRLTAGETSINGISKADKADGNTEKDPFNSESYSLNGALDFKSLTLRGSLSYVDSEVEYDSYGFITGVQDGNEKSNTEQFIGSASASLQSFNARLQSSILISQSDVSRDYYTNNLLTFGASGRRDSFRYQGNINLNQFNKIAFGFEKEKNRVDNDESIIDGSFLLYEYRPTSMVTISTGIRNDDHNQFGSKTTRKVSGVLKATENLTIRSSWGEGFKVPTIFQATYFCCGANEANKKIGAETSSGYDFGLELLFNEGVGSFAITYFNQEVDDQINFSFGVGGYENIDKVFSEGVEVLSEYKVSDFVNLYANYSYIDSTDGDGSSLYNVAKNSGEVGFIFNLNKKYSGSFLFKYNGSEMNTYGKLDSWVRADVNGSFKTSNFGEWFFRIENLFNEEYQQVFGYGTPDLSGSIGIRMSF